MKGWIIASIAAVVLIALGGFLILKYGRTSQDTGAAVEKSEQSQAVVETIEKDQADEQKIERETKAMDDPAVIRDLDRLGILRDDADR